MEEEIVQGRVLSGEETAEHVENMTYKDKQVQELGLDLTIKDVSVPSGPGSVDFGGSEYRVHEKEPVPMKIPPGEKHGWWDLTPGQYIITYNEKFRVPVGRVGIIQPLDRILDNNTFHPSSMVTDAREPVAMVMSVGEPGIRIKQNARISRLYMF
jgi:deoxycytidine triphosphate deaminase